jgi:hypothetical protein
VVAPYVAATSAAYDGATLALHLAGVRLSASLRDGSVSLGVGVQDLRSRRFHRAEAPAQIGISLTGTHLTAWSLEAGAWQARARHDLRDTLDTRDEAALADLRVELPTGGGTVGGFGQLGLRDVRFVTDASGRPLREDGTLWLPATHLVRADDRWLVATSTWGDFETPTTRSGRRTPSGLRVTLAASDADLLRGTHVLDTRELPLPTDGLASIATWDPHLVHRDGEWLVGFVSARKFFDFHPGLASGPALDDLRLRGAATDRTSTEGTTLVEVDGRMVVLASDGRDSRRGTRARFPVFDLAMSEVGLLDAPYPTNLPWPSLAEVDGGWLMATFNGRRAGGDLLGYGTHGDLVVMRSQ